MQPDTKFITITDNLNKIKLLLDELVLQPRIKALEWSRETKQTPNIKIGYPGQHLAALITGMEGQRSAGRGNDLRDGSEVKSCSRIDQLDRCKETECGASVARSENRCPACDSEKIERKKDSKWLFSVREKKDLTLLTKGVSRIVLILGDYPNFSAQDYNTLRFRAYEIWPRHQRHKRFTEILTNYYDKIYSEHKKLDANKSPAPKNFYPDQIQFYLCNPILTFACEVQDSLSIPKIEIKHYVEPDQDRSSLASVPMPPSILKKAEIHALINGWSLEQLNAVFRTPVSSKEELQQMLQQKGVKAMKDYFVDFSESARDGLALRDTDKIAPMNKAYERKKPV